MNVFILYNGLTLNEDGATAHSAKMDQAWSQKNYTAFWLEEMWPPSSPDPNPMDFGICSVLEQKACVVSQPSVEALKKKLTDS